MTPNKILPVFCAFLVFAGIFMSPVQAADTQFPVNPFSTDEAERLYQYYGDTIYQIQVIDLTSSKKSSIGSGFQFTANGLIATNYHVVADAIQRSSQNRIEYVGADGASGKLTVVAADVIHDLAILKRQGAEENSNYITPGKSKLAKGTRIYSLGNPHDIGFTIIEGNYNGLDQALNEKINFSGSLNPGMSGGPALDRKGNVIGINVSTSGNAISFLVPVEYLSDLYTKYSTSADKRDFIANAPSLIEQQLLENQDKYMGDLINSPWETIAFGPVMVPARIADYFKCWGSPGHKEGDPYQHHRSTCSSQEQIFLDDDFTTGSVIYRYDSIEGNSDLNLFRFNTLYEQNYGLPLDAFKNATEADVTRFFCNTKFLDTGGKRWKSSFCVRQYKKYPDLYDLHLYMALVGEGRKGLLVSVITEGVSKENALKFTQKFLSSIHPLSEKE